MIHINFSLGIRAFKLFLVLFFLVGDAIGNNTTTDLSPFFPQPIHIVGNNIDELVLKGIKHIKDHGELFQARAGSGQQSYDVTYTLVNPLNRVHNIRRTVAVKYLCREFLAYFNGSLNVDDGLAQASSMWKTLADKNNEIASNYGYYVFHQKLPENEGMTQYDWVITNLAKNLDSRKAFININQLHHKKSDSKDYPCTLGLQFFVRNNHLCCSVASRSTDIYTGLPYDMGFFSFVTELVYRDLKGRLNPEEASQLKLGYVSMRTNFTQIYDKTRGSVLKLLEKFENNSEIYHSDMPAIHDAQATLKDIYAKTTYTPVMKWIHKHAELEK
ncbi:thymidylate synthase [Candidatus Dependentiae bacterium]|nr:thymidylate synthase [Candidatus Dependentiae bacterium]